MRLLLITFLILPFIAFGQNCLPSGITFSTQADIDNFATNYPGCTQILGDVCIGDCTVPYVSSVINNLNGLSSLLEIGGSLTIRNNNLLPNIDDLNNLNSIGGNLTIRSNPGLLQIDGLSNLTSIDGGIELTFNDQLNNTNGLSNVSSTAGTIDISSNASLANVDGLNPSGSINGNVIFNDNVMLSSINGLSQVDSISGLLVIANNTVLNTLLGFSNLVSVGSVVEISRNTALPQLSGLNNLTTIGNALWVTLNPNLSNLLDLSSLESVGGELRILNNDALSNLTGLDNVNSIGNILRIQNNDILSNIKGIENIDPNSIQDIKVSLNPLLSVCEIQSICNALELPGTTTDIHDNASGCNSEAEVQTACDALLPVTWSTPLTATLQENTILLSWSVSHQENNEKFIVEHSKDGVHFSDIGHIVGQANYTPILAYSYHHVSPASSQNYYRIKQVDSDDRYSYSNIAQIDIEQKGLTVFPNPASTEITLTSEIVQEIEIVDTHGRLVKRILIEKGSQQIDISTLLADIYFVKDQNGIVNKIVIHAQ